jgi:hypothetical protein
MGLKKDLVDSEKQTIVGMLKDSLPTLEIAKRMNRDHRTIKRFIGNILHLRQRRDKGRFLSISTRQKVLLKRAVAKNPLSTSRTVFNEAGINGVSRSTRWRILQHIATCKTAIARPPLSSQHKVRRMAWAELYLKQDFSNVIFTDECRATLDGPDGFSRGWILDGLDIPPRLRRQQGGGGVMFWAGLYGSTVVGPFRVPDGVKMKSADYTAFLTMNFLPWYRSLPVSKKKSLVFMQDNAPSHASLHTKTFLASHGFVNSKYMDWPSASPDLNPLENYWAVFKARLYAGGRQFSSKNELWNVTVATFAEMDPSLARTLSQSVDRRLVEVLKCKGTYIHH